MKMVWPCSRRSRGFTLIELLVVIAIIALLAAILFPVFARSRENARRASCQSNEKQILLGMLQYVQDYDERMPLLFSFNAAPPQVVWPQIFYPYTKSTQIFKCPSDSSTTINSWMTSTTVSGFGPPMVNSYMMNEKMGGSGLGGILGGFTFPGVSITTVARAANTVYLCDSGSNATNTTPGVNVNSTDKTGAWGLLDPALYVSTGLTADVNWAGPRLRHLETVNVGFVDGHVKALNASWYYPGTPWLDPAVGGN